MSTQPVYPGLAGREVSGSVLTLRVTAREQAFEQARVAAEVTSLMCSGHQLLNESGLPRTFPQVRWTVVDHRSGRDPSWVVCEDAADPTYMLTVRRSGRPVTGPTGHPQYRHTVRVVVPSRWPWKRWNAVGPNITRPEHLAIQLAVLDARRSRSDQGRSGTPTA